MRTSITTVAAVAIGQGATATAAPAKAPGAPRRVLRLAHLTDVHVQPGISAERGMATCLHHVQSHEDPPTLILTGGDSVMDAMSRDLQTAEAEAEVWRRILKSECSLPVHSCIGNHDIWGWNKSGSGTTGNEPGWGKAFGEDLLGLSKRYYHVDVAGWRIIVLDSTHPSGNKYIAKLDEEQFDWLEKLLGEAPASTPIAVLSHIPIVSGAVFFDGPNEKTGNWEVSAVLMHIDSRQIQKLFQQHPNVKLCLSGHLHMIDQVMLRGVTYCCNGAVCGGWWKGDYQGFDPSYAIVDLFEDGSIKNEIVTYDWKA